MRGMHGLLSVIDVKARTSYRHTQKAHLQNAKAFHTLVIPGNVLNCGSKKRGPFLSAANLSWTRAPKQICCKTVWLCPAAKTWRRAWARARPAAAETFGCTGNGAWGVTAKLLLWGVANSIYANLCKDDKKVLSDVEIMSGRNTP